MGRLHHHGARRDVCVLTFGAPEYYPLRQRGELLIYVLLLLQDPNIYLHAHEFYIWNSQRLLRQCSLNQPHSIEYCTNLYTKCANFARDCANFAPQNTIFAPTCANLRQPQTR